MVKPNSKQSRGCLGCFTKPALVTAVDEPSKGLKIQGRPVRKSSVSEDIWSSSTVDMDTSALQSQRSISSISTANQALNPQSTSISTLKPPEFVNHGKFMLLASHNFVLLTCPILNSIKLVFVYCVVFGHVILVFLRSPTFSF